VEIDGRSVSLARRRAMSGGKTALAAAAQQRAATAPAATPPAQAAPATVQPPSAQVTVQPVGDSARVTGAARDTFANVSGSAAIDAPASSSARTGVPKVGYSRTGAGAIVSGTLVRSKVSVTGDEAGASAAITGEADQRPEDDLTPRNDGGPRRSRFSITMPGTAHAFAARDRERTASIESTDRGLPVTGPALGRSPLVTGDEEGAYRSITGNQYNTPSGRPAPVRGARAAAGVTWAGQRLTGVHVEPHERVSGTSRDATTVTGSQYQGSGPLRAPSAAGVSGDAPIHDAHVTGTERGSARSITGTPYYREQPETQPGEDAIARIDERFSIRSPQRSAQRRAAAAGEGATAVTGSFAGGTGKCTGNLEFEFRSRSVSAADQAARLRVTGEGRAAGPRITGAAWNERDNVTGTEGSTASGRNPSVRAGTPQAFANARRFKALASHEEPKHLVTGMSGYSSDSAAKVTLSGGAQG